MKYNPLLNLYCSSYFFAELPDAKPTLWTESDRYEPGDVLRANCSSPPSKPKADLTLTVNNVVVRSSSINLTSQSLQKAPNHNNIYLQIASADKYLFLIIISLSSVLCFLPSFPPNEEMKNGKLYLYCCHEKKPRILILRH
jgi:hypothetical protein